MEVKVYVSKYNVHFDVSSGKNNKFIKQVPDRFVLVPTYNCNLSCTYCYQKMIQKKSDIATFSLIDRMFSTIEKISSKKYESPIVTSKGCELLESFPTEFT